MWGNSCRWYAWWTGIALLTVAVAGQFASPNPKLGRRRALCVGLLVGALFYINYITILFAMALVAALAYRYGRDVWKQILLASGSACLLAAPQMHAFWTVHMRSSGGQRTSLFLSFARLEQGLLASEAFLPWHPIAALTAVVLAALTVSGARLTWIAMRRRDNARVHGRMRALVSVNVFAFAFLALIAVGGLGGKPRNGLLLAPALAPVIAFGFEALRLPVARHVILSILTLWSGFGIKHLLGREGLAKASMNNRPEEVLRFIQQSRGTDCSVVVTYDPLLTFYLVESRLPQQLILTVNQNSLYQDAAPFSTRNCPAVDLYTVRSFTGGFGSEQEKLSEIIDRASDSIQPPLHTSLFSYDPSARFERRLPFLHDVSTLPDYRYVVTSGALASPAALGLLEERMPELVKADGRSVPLRGDAR